MDGWMDGVGDAGEGAEEGKAKAGQGYLMDVWWDHGAPRRDGPPPDHLLQVGGWVDGVGDAREGAEEGNAKKGRPGNSIWSCGGTM